MSFLKHSSKVEKRLKWCGKDVPATQVQAWGLKPLKSVLDWNLGRILKITRG